MNRTPRHIEALARRMYESGASRRPRERDWTFATRKSRSFYRRLARVCYEHLGSP